MHARLAALWDRVQSSYWFIPSLMTIGAVVLSFVTPRIDEALGPDWMDRVDWLYANRPEGARALLSEVAGSMIGVAGVTFSITVASVVYASGQYGPRLLTNFMRDRGNQVTLGTFIATFLYCLLVLRTVRSADEGGAGAFVPHVGVLTGLALALASVGVLIYFVHHIPHSIHVSNVLAGVGRELEEKIDKLFPEAVGREASDVPADVPAEGDGLPEALFREAIRVRADSSGYVQGVDEDTLLDLGSEHDLVLHLQRRPGDFVAEGDALALVWPPARANEDVRRRVRRAYAWGSQRTAMQDVRFLVNELVEIASRALSSGVNDPFTAITCIDWLGAALKRVADRETPAARRYDRAGTLRVVARGVSFEEFVASGFGQLRPYAAGDRNAALRLLRVMGEVGGRLGDPRRRAVLRAEADALLAGAEEKLAVPQDLEDVREAHRTLREVLDGRMPYEAFAALSPDVGGSA